MGQGAMTKTGFSPGTVDYMAPEHIRNQTVTRARICTAWE
jgi:hypothetical protein